MRNKGLRVTKQRMMVMKTVAGHPGEHLTVEEIHALVRAEYPEIGVATIYRAMSLLVKMRLIDKVNLNDGYVRYELNNFCKSRHHHHHAVCESCGKIFSFEDDLLDCLEKAVYDGIGFTVTDHEVRLYGYCKDCMKVKNEHNNMEVSD